MLLNGFDEDWICLYDMGDFTEIILDFAFLKSCFEISCCSLNTLSFVLSQRYPSFCLTSFSSGFPRSLFLHFARRF